MQNTASVYSFFSDASQIVDHGRLCFIFGLLIGPFESESILHIVSKISQKSGHSFKSSSAAEVLAAAEAIAERKVLAACFRALLGMNAPVWVTVDPRDLYKSFSTQRIYVDRPIIPVVILIQ